MRKILDRILAYALDSILITMILFGISNIKFINPNIDKINKLNDEYYEVYTQYNSLKDYLKDNEDLSEYKDDYSYFIESINGVDKEELKDTIDKEYQDLNSYYSYRINKSNKYQYLINIAIIILYFGVLQYFLKGQTLFKKLLKIKVVSEEDKELSLVSFIIRSILVGEVLFILAHFINIMFIKESSYVLSYNLIYNINTLYEVIFILFILLRNDNKGLQDLILKTKVIKVDKLGNEVKEEVKKEKEYVEAEIINDKKDNN